TKADAQSGGPEHGLVLKVEYGGALPGHPWHSACLVEPGKTNELSAWRNQHPKMADWFLGSVISKEAAERVRGFLNQAEVAARRKRVKPKGMSEYVVTVEDQKNQYYIEIGFDADTVRFIGELAARIGNESAEPLSRITNRIWFLHPASAGKK